MPNHIKFLLRHAAFGAVLAAAFVAMLLYANVANLWHLVTHTQEGVLATALLWVFCTITFGSAQMGIRIMMLADDDADEGDRGNRPNAPQHATVPVPIHRPDR
ncbi:hypothetical protein V8J82_12055 [Gymnodinialimonas sp. 2305UL16-5]|uniref:hypothetical protein n=1 Tax=Gymnodinialimonas mytili TaxID=3126503 RepID=UPI00309631EA